MKWLINYIFSLISINEEDIRRERILNILLVGVVFLSSYLLIAAVINNRFISEPQGEPLEIVTAFTLTFWALFFFSKAGFYRLVSYIFVGIMFLISSSTLFKWGADVPQGLLAFALIIVISGILIGAKFALVTLIICALALFGIGYLQINNIIIPNRYWISEFFKYRDLAAWTVTLGVLALVSWLFNREMEKALKRARASEKALQKERNSLEIKVEKRTQELQKIQLEKVMQIYRFADFGKLAAGLFHDLVTPLNVVSLNLENLKEETNSDKSKNIKEIRRVLKRAIYSTKGIEKFVKNTRLQLQGQQTKSYFNLVQEIDNALEGLADKALKAEVKLDFGDGSAIHTFGNPFRFHQMAANLVLNAVDSYTNIKRKSNRVVHIRLFRRDNLVVFEIEDFGIGVPRNILPHIFDPFYTTKPIEEGIGIGLTICKDIAEKDFGGSITVKSQPKKGTIFRVQFPGKELYDAQEHI
jgi:signal transduction histidine kinase